MLKQPDKGKTVAIVIGAGRRNGDHENMAITATDAVRVKNVLVDFCPFLEANCHCLTNKSATKDQIIHQLKQLAAQNTTERAELVVFYISAHGCFRDGEFYIICNDTLDYDIPRTALSGKVLLELLDEINSDKLLVLLDCCHANGIHMPEAMTFEKAAFLQKPNRLVLAASHAKEVAYLSRPVSVFTFALIEVLTGQHFKSGDMDVDVFGLAMYVRERVAPLSRLRQRPQLHVLKQGSTTNFVIARHPTGKRGNVFEEGFCLLDEEGKEMPLSEEIAKDIDYRQQFNWFITTENYQVDNSVTNVEINNVTISQEFNTAIIIQESTIVINNGNGENNSHGPGLGGGRPSNKTLLPAKLDLRPILDIILMKNNQFLIARSRVKEHLYKMLHDETGLMLILEGQPETGLSHLTNLFSEIAEKYGCYEYRYINLCDLSKVYPGKMIGPWLIAKVMAGKMGMDFTFSENKFDVDDFLNMLRLELDSHVHQHRMFFFYFDQFNVKCTSDLPVFMMELAKLVCVENSKMFLVIGGYKEVKQWPKYLRHMLPPLLIGQYFEKDAVNTFLQKLYYHEAYNFYERVNLETYLESTRPHFPDSLFATPSIPNISAVGDALSTWFLSIRNKINYELSKK